MCSFKHCFGSVTPHLQCTHPGTSPYLYLYVCVYTHAIIVLIALLYWRSHIWRHLWKPSLKPLSVVRRNKACLGRCSIALSKPSFFVYLECPLSICWAVQLGFYLVLVSKKQISKIFLQWKILRVKLIAPLPHGFQDNCVPCDWEEGEILMWFVVDIEMDIWVYFSILCFAYARWFKLILFLLFSTCIEKIW